MRLPPPSPENAIAIAEYTDALVQQCSQDTRRLDWLREIDRGNNLYLGNHFETTAPNEVRVVLNRVQNCIISLMAIQGGDPPAVTFTPRETGDPPLYYLNGLIPEGKLLLDQLVADGTALEDGTLWTAADPLPDAVVKQLQAKIDMGQVVAVQAAAMGAAAPAGVMPPEVLVEVSDATAAEALQTVFDGMWEESNLQYAVAENILLKNIFGYQPSLYEFDDDTQRHSLTNIHCKQVFVDELKSDLAKSTYVIYDEGLDVDEAIALHPGLEAEIVEAASTGPLQFPGSQTYDPAFRFTQSFRRQMVAVRHAWFKHQPYPRDAADAVARGLLRVVDVPTGDVVPVPDEATGELAPHMPTRTAYVLPDTGKEVTPADKAWPRRFGIRQVRIIANRCVEDRECEFTDIPVPGNINLLVPYSPYGQGEPARLEGLQMALNYVLSAIVTHQRYNAVPPELIPASVVALMDKALEKMRTNPGQRVVVPDALIQAFGDVKKLVTTLDVPALPADFWKLLQFLVEMIDKEGNQSDVMQGDASGSWSGEAIASLQNAASQVIRAKSMYTEFYIRRVVGLMCESITRRMSPADWRRYCSSVPYHALEALHSRNKSLHVDVAVQIKSASGAAKQAETNNLVMARQNGVPISDPTLMERLGIDPDAEQAKQAEYVRRSVASAGQQQQQAAQQPPNGGGGKAKQKGDTAEA